MRNANGQELGRGAQIAGRGEIPAPRDLRPAPHLIHRRPFFTSLKPPVIFDAVTPYKKSKAKSETFMTIVPREPEFDEDEWDPSGLNAIEKVDLESFSDPGEGEEELDGVTIVTIDTVEEDVGESESEDLGIDGLTELELMERSLLQEESLDFIGVGEEE